MGRFFVLPYKMASEGGKMLAEGLGGLRMRPDNRSEYRYQEGDCVVNWGVGAFEYGHPITTVPAGVLLNPEVNICINKKLFFERMQGHNIVPPFAFTADEARRHLQFPIVCRTTVEGADGSGIIIAESRSPDAELPRARLYTQLLEKTAEYRVHLGRSFNGDIVLIAAQKKRRNTAMLDSDNPIWTGDGVFLDYIEPSELPRHVFDVTKRSMELMPELHFGGFDTIDTPSWGARVVEVNSAPMMTEQTTRKYVEFIKQYVLDRDVEATAPVVEESWPARLPGWQPSREDIDRVIDDLVMMRLTRDELISGYLQNLCIEH